jgi:hypothetical protein
MQSLRVSMSIREAERVQRQRKTSHYRTRKTKQHRRPQQVAAPPAPVPPVEHRDRVLTLQQWCEINAFSLATGRRILNSGNGPSVLQLSPRRIGIKESANAAWQASRAR